MRELQRKFSIKFWLLQTILFRNMSSDFIQCKNGSLNDGVLLKFLVKVRPKILKTAAMIDHSIFICRLSSDNICISLFTFLVHILQCYTSDNFRKKPNLHKNSQKRQYWQAPVKKYGRHRSPPLKSFFRGLDKLIDVIL